MNKFYFALLTSLLSTTIHAQVVNLEWVAGMGGTGQDWGRSIAVDASGNVYSTGYFEGTADFDPGPGTVILTSAGGRDAYLQKLNASGNHLWTRQIGGSGEDMGEGVVLDDFGHIYITGSFEATVDFDPGPGVANLTTNGIEDVFVQKLDTAGNHIWARNIGGVDLDDPESIALDPQGNPITIGRFIVSGDFDPGPGTAILTSAGGWDTFIQKMDSAGNYLWVRQLGGWNHEYGMTIKVDALGNIYSTGVFRSTTLDFDPGPGTANLTLTGGRDIYVQKLDSSGNYLWAKSMGGTGVDWGIGIVIDPAGNLYTTGYFEGTADFDPGPGTAFITSAGSRDCYVQKLDNSGNHLWVKRIGGTGDDSGNCIAVDALANVYTIGGFEGTVDFDPGQGIANLTSAGARDIYIQKLDSSGNFLWVKQMGSTGGDGGQYLILDDLGNIYTTGFFEGTVDFDPGTATTNLTSVGNVDIFVQKLSKNTVVNETITICEGEEYEGYINTGVYVDTFIAQSGCDSIRVLDLTVIDISTSNIAKTICNGEEYEGYISTGIYVDTFTAQSGCDSIRILDLSVISRIEYNVVENICQGESFDGYTSSGIYIDTIFNTNGCDSIRTLELSVYSVFIPNAFSPNNDGINDKFQIFAKNQDLRIKTYQIYNRWGEKVYSRNDFRIGDFNMWWDGSYNNEVLENGVYVYYIELYCLDKIIPLSGDIAIVK